jgi:hypothetical protein
MNGAPAWLEFDGKGTMMVQFTMASTSGGSKVSKTRE